MKSSGNRLYMGLSVNYGATGKSGAFTCIIGRRSLYLRKPPWARTKAHARRT